MTEALETVITADGRAFRFAGAESYTRKDGTPTGLLCWRGTCAVCGAAFTVKTPRSLEGSKSFGRRHCDIHKLDRAPKTRERNDTPNQIEAPSQKESPRD